MNIITPLQSTTLPGQITPQAGTEPRAPLPFQPGQLLKAVVIEARPDNSILLKIGDNQLTAKAEVALKPGQSLQLQLTSTSPQLQLKIVGDTVNQFLGRSLTLVGNTIDVNGLFQTLQQPSSLFNSLSLSSKQALENFFSLQQSNLGSSSGGNAVKQLVDRLGLSFENAIARGDTGKAASTLKASLMEILATFTKGSQASEGASKLLATLEFFQLAQLHTDTSQQFIFPLPLPFLEQGFLLIDRKPGGEEESGEYKDEEYRFSLHLKMTDLGNMRIDFFHSQEGLFIRFHADSKEKAEFISTFSDQLKEVITDTPILGLSFAADAEEPATELARLIIPEGGSVLDTTA